MDLNNLIKENKIQFCFCLTLETKTNKGGPSLKCETRARGCV